MNAAPACGRPDCPVATPDPVVLRRLRSNVWPVGTRLYRGHHHGHSPDELVGGQGDTRFAPLPDTAHAYVSASRSAALLESALHHLSGADPTVYRVELARWALTEVALNAVVRLVDLRNYELDRLGLARTQLVNTDPLHYPCTRRWAATLQHRHIGGRRVGGIVWHSRQAELHALAHPESVLGDLLAHRSVEVAVLWHPHGPAAPLRVLGSPEPLLGDAGPSQLVRELTALLGAPME